MLLLPNGPALVVLWEAVQIASIPDNFTHDEVWVVEATKQASEDSAIEDKAGDKERLQNGRKFLKSTQVVLPDDQPAKEEDKTLEELGEKQVEPQILGHAFDCWNQTTISYYQVGTQDAKIAWRWSDAEAVISPIPKDCGYRCPDKAYKDSKNLREEDEDQSR